MNNVIYHLFSEGDGIERFFKTYKKIQSSGLMGEIEKIYVNSAGSKNPESRDRISHLHKVEWMENKNPKNESGTINFLRDFSIDNAQSNILYLHSKGAARATYKGSCVDCINSWVDFMEYFLITKYKECLKILEDYDSCGCNTSGSTGNNLHPENSKHYSGNFWWARASYLKSLKPCPDDRSYPEAFFLFSGGGVHKNIKTSEIIYPRILREVLDPNSYIELDK